MKIKALRKKTGLTQTELAKCCETTQQQIAKIENGIVDPKVSTLEKLADALQVDAKDLFYSRKEFLSLIESGIKELELSPGKHNLVDINYFMSRHKSLPSFHRYWEELEIHNTTLKYKEV